MCIGYDNCNGNQCNSYLQSKKHSQSVGRKQNKKPDILLTPLIQDNNNHYHHHNHYDYSAQLVCLVDQHLEWSGYNWLKNGQTLSSNSLHKKDDEIIEDLYPTGSRLLIVDMMITCKYTCLVTTPWGTIAKHYFTPMLTLNSANNNLNNNSNNSNNGQEGGQI